LLESIAAEQGRPVPTLTPAARRAIEAYRWPGNVRELANRLKRAVIMAEGPRITELDLELDAPDDEIMPLNLREVRDQAERRAVARALEHADDNLSQAAGLLGITRPTLYSLLDKYDMRPERGEDRSEAEESADASNDR
jgi:two-component system NtrC family response regulator